jgi:hypothetical protein
MTLVLWHGDFKCHPRTSLKVLAIVSRDLAVAKQWARTAGSIFKNRENDGFGRYRSKER